MLMGYRYDVRRQALARLSKACQKLNVLRKKMGEQTCKCMYDSSIYIIYICSYESGDVLHHVTSPCHWVPARVFDWKRDAPWLMLLRDITVMPMFIFVSHNLGVLFKGLNHFPAFNHTHLRHMDWTKGKLPILHRGCGFHSQKVGANHCIRSKPRSWRIECYVCIYLYICVCSGAWICIYIYIHIMGFMQT